MPQFIKIKLKKRDIYLNINHIISIDPERLYVYTTTDSFSSGVQKISEEELSLLLSMIDCPNKNY